MQRLYHLHVNRSLAGPPRPGSRRRRAWQCLQKCTCDLLLSDVTDNTPSLLMRPECWSSRASCHRTDPHTVMSLHRHWCPTRCARAYLDPVWQKVRLDDIEPHVNFSILRVHIALVTFRSHGVAWQCMPTRTASQHGVDSPVCSHSDRRDLHFESSAL